MSFFVKSFVLSFLFHLITSGIPTITTKGQKFFTSDGDEWSIRGVIYQTSNGLGSMDSGSQCAIDAAQISSLGANTIRLRYVEADSNSYDSCMQAFEDAGLYVLLNLSDENDFTMASLNWTSDLRAEYMKKMDVFQKYDNTLGFTIGDYAIASSQVSSLAPYIKAAISDMKLYRDRMAYRSIPIGYAMGFVADLRGIVQDYLDCDSNGAGTIDFFSADTFSWCASNTLQGAGYQDIIDDANGFDVPYFVSATGCNQVRPRTFDNLEAIYGSAMSDRISGAIVKQWYEDNEQFGLASYSDSAASGTPTLLPDYTSLSSRWAAIPTPTGVNEDEYEPVGTKRACPTVQDGEWDVNAAVAIPTIGTSGLPEARVTTSSGGPLPTATQDTDSGAPRSGSRASNGANIGVLIGFVVAAIFFVSVLGLSIWFCCRYRTNKRQAQANIELGKIPDLSDKEVAMQSTDSLSRPSPPVASGTFELPSRETAGTEMSAVRDPGEADSTPLEETSVVTWPLPARRVNPFDDQYAESVQRPSTSGSHSSAAPIDPAILSEVKKKQKQMEVDYLESEEAKLRERREQLMNQTHEGP